MPKTKIVVAGRRRFSDLLTATVNRKGVLDVDVVKGCPAGIAAHGDRGCYQACYAANIARFRGIDFSRAVVRKVTSSNQARKIERAVRKAPYGFFRVGTMGEPSHAWGETVRTVEWLAPYAIPVIITKHWCGATDAQLRQLAANGAIINTSVSALDSEAHLGHRLAEIQRYARMGGISVARVVSCDFNTSDATGYDLDLIQQHLLALRPVIDNPLRVASTHHLVQSGLIRIRRVKDLAIYRSISLSPDSGAYVGHCSGCSDVCGAGLLSAPHLRPSLPQLWLF